MPGEKQLLEVSDLAALFKRKERTIWKWAKSGGLPKGAKLGHKSRYWWRSDIEDWIAAGGRKE
jgi:predicted DNA-binding transcriptional regulator AlpA